MWGWRDTFPSWTFYLHFSDSSVVMKQLFEKCLTTVFDLRWTFVGRGLPAGCTLWAVRSIFTTCTIYLVMKHALLLISCFHSHSHIHKNRHKHTFKSVQGIDDNTNPQWWNIYRPIIIFLGNTPLNKFNTAM